MDNFWVSKPINSEMVSTFKKELNIPSSIAQLLLSIGITTIDEANRFLFPSLKQIHNPLLMKDMEKAIKRISDAIDRKERILFHGDYDCGATRS